MNWQKLCKDYGLDATPEFWKASEADIEKIYNGAGPDNFFPPRLATIIENAIGSEALAKLNEYLREELTGMLEEFQAVFVIHDFDFAFSNGTEEGFHEANERMLANMKKIINKAYLLWKFWMWRSRVKLYAKAEIVFYACEEFGLDAWKD